jgi:threonine synthase
MEPWRAPRTVAEGLRVPMPLADREILHVLRASGGAALAVDDEEILRSTLVLAREEGVLTSPEGGATLAAVTSLLSSGGIAPGARVVLFLTGSAAKAPDALRAALRR